MANGIGDTIRVSLTDDPVAEEAFAGYEILKALNLREKGINLAKLPHLRKMPK
ncbi:MAG: flavodoxin-dependent (E)-4-hydroxy-3-methylbut-2-enyl-diphosphate synthase [Desulfobacterales bacterium]|nr:flavodoxin-dependent (E)-4-hydroxy-3-methylbut-2-enyl-diphosphate synthase [Desulfobacterales bacterium]